MKTYTLKSVVRRGSMLAAAIVVAGAAILPATSASADALNPLTDRSLTLSSSAPGWDDKDGSGNTTYSEPNSGANGRQTGNTFSFKVSSDGTADDSNGVDAMTFQYCVDPAGDCTAPGNGALNAAARTSNLKVVTSTPTEINNSTANIINTTTGEVDAVPNKDDSQGSYLVMWNNAGTWEQSTDWVMTATNVEDGTGTGEANFIKLAQATSDEDPDVTTGLAIPAGAAVKVFFFATEDNYITNPGEGAFFVKINTYNSVATQDDTTLVDGGVTVANVMNLGIQIQTKVLETMDFSVGTVDPNTLNTAQFTTATGGQTTHGICNPILNAMDPADTENYNVLKLGSEDHEYALNVNETYSTHSYFRLSSNASAGATVYYSGVTLSNTVGDKIKAIGTSKLSPSPGSEQFGLALANGVADTDTDADTIPDWNSDDWAIDYGTERAAGYVYESGADNTAAGLQALNELNTPGATGIDPSVQTDWTAGSILGKAPQLTVRSDGILPDVALKPTANYDQGAGVVNTHYGALNTKFAFDANSNKIPVAIAEESNAVVDCASAKVRYIANIAATTPAGIYTTKINFIAAPQY